MPPRVEEVLAMVNCAEAVSVVFRVTTAVLPSSITENAGNPLCAETIREPEDRSLLAA